MAGILYSCLEDQLPLSCFVSAKHFRNSCLLVADDIDVYESFVFALEKVVYLSKLSVDANESLHKILQYHDENSASCSITVWLFVLLKLPQTC